MNGLIIPGDLCVKNNGKFYSTEVIMCKQADIYVKDADLVVDGGLVIVNGPVRIGGDCILVDDTGEIGIKED